LDEIRKLNPDVTSPIGIIGAGRLGSSLALALTAAGRKVVSATTTSLKRQVLLQAAIPDAFITENISVSINLSDVVFVTCPDGVISDIAASQQWRPKQTIIHCSGALSLDALSTVRQFGAVGGSFHPIQTFPSPDSAQNFAKVTFGIEADNPNVLDYLKLLASDLGGQSVPIPTDHRDAYHASAVMSSGLLSAWLGVAADMWSLFGYERHQALQALSPLITSTAQAVVSRGVPASITGPYVRGDVETVATHIEATSSAGVDVARAYAAMALATIKVAAEQGSLGEDSQREIEMILNKVLKTSSGDQKS
jgi:predicted short-subunit dehydrogenase-like oxidoreductase (DUF2520 family)